MVDPRRPVTRESCHEQIALGPDGDSSLPGDRLQHRRDITYRSQFAGHGLQRLVALGQYEDPILQHSDLVLEVGPRRRRRIPLDPDQAAVVAPGLAFDLLHTGLLHAVQHGELREGAERVAAEQRISGVIRCHLGDQAVAVPDLDDFGLRDGRLLGGDGRVDPQQLGRGSDGAQDGQHLGPRVLTQNLDAGLATDIGVVQHLGRSPEQGEALLVRAPPTWSLKVRGRPVLAGPREDPIYAGVPGLAARHGQQCSEHRVRQLLGTVAIGHARWNRPPAGKP